MPVGGGLLGAIIGFIIYGLLVSAYLSIFGYCTAGAQVVKCPPLISGDFGLYFTNSYTLLGGSSVFALYLFIGLILFFTIIGFIAFPF